MAYVNGSTGLTSKSNEDISRMIPNAAVSPIATPTPASVRPCTTNMRVTACPCAPSAMRMPISRVRCDTEYEITP